jgi:hypothetical protein
MDEKKKNRALYAKIIIIQLVLQLAIFPIIILLEKLRNILYDYFETSLLFIYIPVLIIPIITMVIPKYVLYKTKRRITEKSFTILTLLPLFTSIPMIVIGYIICWYAGIAGSFDSM